MGELNKQTVVNAPLEKVFSYVANVSNAPRYSSSITQIVSGPSGDREVGQKWQARVNFLGQPRSIVLRLGELHPPNRLRFDLLGDPAAALLWRLEVGNDPQRTHVSLTLQVPSVPSMMLNLMMGGLLGGDLQRLKSLLEG